MVDRIDAIAARHDVAIATFGHAGDGNLHPTCVLDSAEDHDAVAGPRRPSPTIFAAAIDLGGTITGEHGVGAAKLPFLAARLGETSSPCCAGSRPPSTRPASSTPESWAHDRPTSALRPGAAARRCISCGFCLPACPTYAMTGDEASSPRGRITLMRALQDGTLPPDDATLAEQSSFCLGCRACEPVCPAGVEYGSCWSSGGCTSGGAGGGRWWPGR